MKKTYYVRIHADAYWEVPVEAESLEQALEKADNEFTEANFEGLEIFDYMPVSVNDGVKNVWEA